MRLQGKKIAILVAEGVEDLEYYVPLMRLQEDGAQVLTAALDIKPIHGKTGWRSHPIQKLRRCMHRNSLPSSCRVDGRPINCAATPL